MYTTPATRKHIFRGLLPYKHAQLQRLGFTLNYVHSKFSYYTFLRASIKCTDQTTWMLRPQEPGFSDHRSLKFRPYITHIASKPKAHSVLLVLKLYVYAWYKDQTSSSCAQTDLYPRVCTFIVWMQQNECLFCDEASNCTPKEAAAELPLIFGCTFRLTFILKQRYLRPTFQKW